MQKTKIEYLTHTWNPISMLCTPVSEGCKNCWHLEVVNRFKLNNGEAKLRERELEAPLRRKKSSRIGVQFMGDLFHKSVPFEWIDKVFAVMALCPQHTFYVLTKREERMFEYYSSMGRKNPLPDRETCIEAEAALIQKKMPLKGLTLPLPNVMLGVTAENQAMADKRIPILLKTPAAMRFVSVEPMLEAILLSHLSVSIPWAGGKSRGGRNYSMALPMLDWVIIGAESKGRKPGRPCSPAWIHSLKTQCQQANTPVFVKQIHADGKLIKSPAGWPREYPKG